MVLFSKIMQVKRVEHKTIMNYREVLAKGRVS